MTGSPVAEAIDCHPMSDYSILYSSILVEESPQIGAWFIRELPWQD